MYAKKARKAKKKARPMTLRRRAGLLGFALLVTAGVLGGYIVYVAPAAAPANSSAPSTPAEQVPVAHSAQPVHVIGPDDVPDTTPAPTSTAP